MIIDRYVRHEIGVPFLAVSAVLVAIFLTFSLTRFLIDANAGLLHSSEVIQLTFLKSLISLEILLPLSLYLGVMIGLGRLYSDSEIYAMRANGISEMRLLRPIIRFALLLAVLSALFSVFVRPWAYAQSFWIKAQAEASTEVDRIQAARFYTFGDSGRTVFIKGLSENGTELDQVFIRMRKNDDLQVITSGAGHMKLEVRPGYHRLILKDANVYKRVVDGPDVFAELSTFSLWIPAAEADPVGYKTKSTSTFELRDSGNSEDLAEFQWRMSTPLSTLLLILLAIPLSRSRPRQGRYARMLAAIVIYSVYFNLLDVSRTWVESGTSAGIWWVPALLGLLVASLYVPWLKFVRKLPRRKGSRS